MTVPELIQSIRDAGGSIDLTDGRRLKVRGPKNLAEMVQAKRFDVVRHLEDERFRRDKTSWLVGPRCPGCRGVWPTAEQLDEHVKVCYLVRG